MFPIMTHAEGENNEASTSCVGPFCGTEVAKNSRFTGGQVAYRRFSGTSAAPARFR